MLTKREQKTALTSSSSQHYSGSFIVSGDILHQVSSVDGPASQTHSRKLSCAGCFQQTSEYFVFLGVWSHLMFSVGPRMVLPSAVDWYAVACR